MAGDDAAGLRHALQATARELATARQTSADLQETVHDLLSCLEDRPTETLLRLQHLDRLTQLLGDLANFLDALAELAPADATVELSRASRALHLRDFAARLSAPAGDSPEPDDDGSLLLF